MQVDDLVDGLIDFNEELTAIGRRQTTRRIEDEDEADAGAIAEREPRAAEGRGAGALRRRSASTTRRMMSVLQKEGHKAPKYLEFQRKITGELMQIRFAARQIEALCDARAHRGRQHPPDRAQDPGPRR